MRKFYTKYLLLFAGGLILSMLISSCHKDHNNTPIPEAKPIATLGLYELESGIYKRAFIGISKVGTVSTAYYSVFDTGSSGMTIDATGILPASMITSTGITVPGDSVVVDGITVTNQTSVIAFGDAQSEIQEFGNLAYATITLGDQNGSVTTSRIPFFLYYKIMDITNNIQLDPHSNDVFGVGPGVSYANSAIGSPLSYFKETNGGISGFKMAILNNAEFSTTPTYVPGLLTIGLVPDDLSSSSGFVMHSLSSYLQGGYSPDIPATVTYNGQTIPATLLFDTGTPAISLIENSQAPTNISQLPANTPVTITTNNGFTYSYNTSATNNVTDIAKPSYTGDPRTIFSINFFTENEFLTNYRDHKIGLKNN